MVVELIQGPASNYKRELDLDTAMVTVSYETEDRFITRQVISHFTENLIIVRITVDGRVVGGDFWLDNLSCLQRKGLLH